METGAAETVGLLVRYGWLEATERGWNAVNAL